MPSKPSMFSERLRARRFARTGKAYCGHCQIATDKSKYKPNPNCHGCKVTRARLTAWVEHLKSQGEL